MIRIDGLLEGVLCPSRGIPLEIGEWKAGHLLRGELARMLHGPFMAAGSLAQATGALCVPVSSARIRYS